MKKRIFTCYKMAFLLLLAGVLSVTQLNAQCNPDIIPPVCVAQANVTVSCENFDPSLWAYPPPVVSDNCQLDLTKQYQGVNGLTHSVNNSLFDTICNRGTLVRNFTVYDATGNTTTCSQSVTVDYVQNYFVKFPNDFYITGGITWPLHSYGEPIFFGEDCELMGISYTDNIVGMVADSVTRVDREWIVVNWCTYNATLPLVDVPNPNPNAVYNHVSNMPGPTVSASGTPVPWQPTISKINPGDPSATNFSTFFNQNANGYRYHQIIYLADTINTGVEGNVYIDNNANCTYETTETTLANWKVKAVGHSSGQVWTTFTDTNGHYKFYIAAAEDSLTVMLDVPFFYNNACAYTYEVALDPDTLVTQNLSFELEDTCRLLSVDISTPLLRRCFNNTYTVQACNQGTTAVDNAYVEVTLDQFMTFQSSTIPSTSLGDNRYSFDLHTLDPGECQVFLIHFKLNCDAPPGATHCAEATVFPNEPCTNFQNWNGAVVKVNGVCEGDSVRMDIKNIGVAPTSQTLDFIVVEDIIMMYNASGSFNLNPGSVKSVKFPANGATWRLEAEQEPGFPWGGVAAAAVEGCGGLNIPGLVTMFPLSSPSPYESTDCQENVGSYDPNDKQASPKGYGEQHLLRANTDIDYTIRFQNTGTDTAFTVVILDTLSPLLDVHSVRPGVGSHPYTFAILDGGVLQFRFDNILLPDSNVNELASHGFIKFGIGQQPDNPNGSLIENDAAIYFDFNAPVITNNVTHLIGENFIEVSGVNNSPATASPLRIFPNPAVESVTFEIPDPTFKGVFLLTNSNGQQVVSQVINGSQFRLYSKNLAPGLYFYNITGENGVQYWGKVIVDRL